MVILASLMIPVQVVLVPFSKTILAFGLLNTRSGLIIIDTRHSFSRSASIS